MVGRIKYNNIFRYISIDCLILTGIKSAYLLLKFGGILSDIVSVASIVSGFLILIFLQSLLLNTESTNLLLKLNNTMTWYVPIIGIHGFKYSSINFPYSLYYLIFTNIKPANLLPNSDTIA